LICTGRPAISAKTAPSVLVLIQAITKMGKIAKSDAGLID
jgi:hypothetical protein